MKILPGLLLLFIVIQGFTQTKLEIHGFIKTDYWHDSRQVVYAREGLFTLYPAPPDLDKNGNDINASPSFNFSAITSRLNIKTGPVDALGGKAFGYIEADFSGMSNRDINGFRLRHAYVKIWWPGMELLLGQYWHPMFADKVFPTVASLNTGAPFQPFIRSPQARLTLHLGAWQLITALMAQRDYASSGPLGRDFSYLSNSVTPNAHLQLRYLSEKHIFGIAADYKTIRPYMTYNNVINKTLLRSYGLMAYYKFQNKKWEWKSKVIAGQNMSECLLLGGYYETANSDTATGYLEFTPVNHVFVWTNLIRTFTFKKSRMKAGVFVGYAKNLGTGKEVGNVYYGTDPNVGALYRVSPNISLITSKLQFILEYETTRMDYGSYDQKGVVNNAKPVVNHRLLFTTLFYF